MALDDKKLAEFKEQEPGLDVYTPLFRTSLALRTTFFQEAEEVLGFL